MSSYAHKHVFLYFHAQTCIKTFIHLSHFKSEKQTELNELNELKCSKTPLQTSSYAHKHVFLYLHAFEAKILYICLIKAIQYPCQGEPRQGHQSAFVPSPLSPHPQPCPCSHRPQETVR